MTGTGEKIVLRGRCVVGGSAEGRAFVTREEISGWGGIDANTATVTEIGHEKRGESFACRVLVFPGAKGSSGWSHYFHITRRKNVAPAAMLFTVTTTKVALGAVVTRVPALTDFDRDPFEVIHDGDWVRVDADAGVVEITPAPPG
ncbi:hypothetical protein C2I36_12160 [Rhodobacteraceae bacterium WD3A24]|nr:hypothetical protein C2I36_12160 [Rhodobacteraceae bacterium WD3A24]